VIFFNPRKVALKKHTTNNALIIEHKRSTKTCLVSYLIFKLPGGYLNFSAWLMKNILFEEKKDKIMK
jgi:hypothetical protein